MKIVEAPQVIRLGDKLDKLREEAYQEALSAPKVTSILQRAKDHKTKKSLEKAGVYTGVLYMAPAQVSGYEMCRKRTKGCTASCLFTSGHGSYKNVKTARLRKTYQFLHRREEFLERLDHEVKLTHAYAERHGFIPAIRLNGTSDIPWEIYPVNGYANIFEANPETNFYDYSKILERFGNVPENYHLTFSLAETKANMADAQKALEMGFNVAAVFDELPDRYMGRKVINGDETDVRFWEVYEEGVIVGLLQKGKAYKDETGFVIRNAG